MKKNKYLFGPLLIVVVSVFAIGYSFYGEKIKNRVSTNNEEARDLNSHSIFELTIENKTEKPKLAPEGMVWIPGGEFSMGSDTANESLCSVKGITSDASPIHRVYVDGFWMDKTEVTNKQFTAFIKATGYITVAEIKPTIAEFPGAPLDKLIAGSLVFSPTPQKVSLTDYLQWWDYVEKADWRHPLGPESSIIGKENYPVVQVCYEDALAYAKWAGKRLATEAEWEFAARGGKTGNIYTWGNSLKKEGKFQANIYQGKFPVVNGDTGEDGYVGIAAVAQFEPNTYGLYDMAGNVWEWVNDWYDADYYHYLARKNELTKNPQGPSTFNDPTEPGTPKRVHRGGSFLCTDKYCTRYMVGTRGKGEIKSSANHIGFRCVKEE